MKEFLNDKERRVMTGLYHLSGCTVADLAKETMINRTTLYPLLEGLIAKGLVSRVTVEDKMLFQAISRTDLEHWIRRKKHEAERAAEESYHWLRHQDQKTQPSLLSEVSYFEGMDGLKSLYADTWRNNNGKMLYCLTDYTSGYAVLDDFLDSDYFPQRVRHGVHVKSLLPDSDIGRREIKRAKALLREMRFLPVFKDLQFEINIYDDKLAIVAFDPKRPSGVLIKNARIAEAMKHIFDYLWKGAASPEKLKPMK